MRFSIPFQANVGNTIVRRLYLRMDPVSTWALAGACSKLVLWSLFDALLPVISGLQRDNMQHTWIPREHQQDHFNIHLDASRSMQYNETLCAIRTPVWRAETRCEIAGLGCTKSGVLRKVLTY